MHYVLYAFIVEYFHRNAHCVCIAWNACRDQRPRHAQRIHVCCKLSTMHLSMDVLQISMNNRCSTYHTVIGYRIICTTEVFFHTAFGWASHILKRAWTGRRLTGFAYFCAFSYILHTCTYSSILFCNNVFTRVTISYFTILYEGYIVSVRRMVADEIRPDETVLLTRVASRGVTGLHTSWGIIKEHARTA